MHTSFNRSDINLLICNCVWKHYIDFALKGVVHFKKKKNFCW